MYEEGVSLQEQKIALISKLTEEEAKDRLLQLDKVLDVLGAVTAGLIMRQKARRFFLIVAMVVTPLVWRANPQSHAWVVTAFAFLLVTEWAHEPMIFALRKIFQSLGSKP